MGIGSDLTDASLLSTNDSSLCPCFRRLDRIGGQLRKVKSTIRSVFLCEFNVQWR